MTDLSLTFEDIYKRVSRFLGYGETPTDEHLRVVKDIVNRAYRQFLYPVDDRTGKEYCWSFLKQLYTIPVQTGKWKYALPEDFSELLTDPIFDDNDGYIALTKITPEQLLDLRVASISSNPPAFYSIVTAPYDLEVGSKYEIWLHDEPDSSYILRVFYKINPLKPGKAADKLVGGIKAAEAILETCFGVAETQEDGEIGIHYRIAKGLIKDLISADSSVDNNVFIGNLATGSIDTAVKRGENARFQLENLYQDEGHSYSE